MILFSGIVLILLRNLETFLGILLLLLIILERVLRMLVVLILVSRLIGRVEGLRVVVVMIVEGGAWRVDGDGMEVRTFEGDMARWMVWWSDEVPVGVVSICMDSCRFSSVMADSMGVMMSGAVLWGKYSSYCADGGRITYSYSCTDGLRCSEFMWMLFVLSVVMKACVASVIVCRMVAGRSSGTSDAACIDDEYISAGYSGFDAYGFDRDVVSVVVNAVVLGVETGVVSSD